MTSLHSGKGRAETTVAVTGSMCDAPRLTRVVVVVPAFNECESINRTVESVRQTASHLRSSGVELDILVVDDGSSDGTGERARDAGATNVIRHRSNQGLGAAVRSGLRAAREGDYDIAVKFDADLQHDPADIPALLGPILADEADIVYGNRFEALEYRMPLVRRAGNAAFSWLMKKLTGWPLKDSQPGILAVNRAYLSEFHLPGDYNYTQQILLDAYHKHMRFAHIPVRFRERRTGASFVSLRYPFKVIPQLVMVMVTIKPLKIFGPIGLGFLLLAAGVFVVQLGWWITGLTPRPVQNVNLVLGSGLFGIQTLFFGILAEIIVHTRR